MSEDFMRQHYGALLTAVDFDEEMAAQVIGAVVEGIRRLRRASSAEVSVVMTGGTNGRNVFVLHSPELVTREKFHRRQA